jgi:hypothetical protein
MATAQKISLPPLAGTLVAGLLAVTPAGGDTILEYTPARTLEVVQATTVRDAPDGEAVRRRSPGYRFTSNQASDGWVRMTGRFGPEQWRPVQRPRWVPEAAVVAVRPFHAKRRPADTTRPRTYRLTDRAWLRREPAGEPLTARPEGTRFTSNERTRHWVHLTGHFPEEGEWQPLDEPRWIAAERVADISPPAKIPEPERGERWAVVDKSAFELRIVEEARGEREVVYRTEVGLGMDDCLPEEHGGECYYTEPGTYHVQFDIYRPDGIDWCIPESMAEEPEYERDLERGKRCFDGVLGRFAVNIGKTYAIHGTQALDSLGKKESHGCIRTHPDAARRIWRYLDKGDRVVIRP